MGNGMNIDEGDELLLSLVPIILAEVAENICDFPTPQRTSILTGAMYLNELLDGNINTFRNAARMDKQAFIRSRNLPVQQGNLEDSDTICRKTVEYSGDNRWHRWPGPSRQVRRS
jgi:hypothetical protein